MGGLQGWGLWPGGVQAMAVFDISVTLPTAAAFKNLTTQNSLVDTSLCPVLEYTFDACAS